MTNQLKDNQPFYTSIAKAYDYIFPLKKPAFEFTKSLINNTSSVLDAGCATGSLSISLSTYCEAVEAFDLDCEMIDIAQKKANNIKNVTFSQGDMLHMENQFQNQKFDVIICYGNTLVHLLSIEEISNFLEQAFQILNTGGKIALQILNYNHIVDDNITNLPTIENDVIKFVRGYKFNPNTNIIDFNTELTIKQNGNIITNTTQLIGIRPKELSQILIELGFNKIEMYSSFKKSLINDNELPLIISAHKN